MKEGLPEKLVEQILKKLKAAEGMYCELSLKQGLDGKPCTIQGSLLEVDLDDEPPRIEFDMGEIRITRKYNLRPENISAVKVISAIDDDS